MAKKIRGARESAETADRLTLIRSHPDQPVRKQFVATLAKGAVDEDARTVRFKITTGSVDRDNDTIDPKGWDVTEYMRNPAVLWAHDYSALPIARAVDVVPTGDGLESTAQFPEKGVHAFADTVFQLLAGGFLNAASVGFRPTEAQRSTEREGGIDFLRQSLLEWSVVPVPANAEALVVARSKGIDTRPIEAWALGVLRGAGHKAIRHVKVGDVEMDQFVDEAEAAAGAACEACGAAYVDGAPACGCTPKPKASSETCPACGMAMTDTTCSGCGWSEAPMDVPPMDMPASAVAAAADPIRWNRQLSKSFDVAGEPLEPSRLEYAWVSRYLETPVQELSVETFFVPSARMGSFLAATDECLAAWKVDALRSMTESGREVPPEYETLQLNSTTSRQFLVEGIRFLRRDDGVKMVSKLQRSWSGLYVTQYVRHEQAEVRAAWTARVFRRAGELNYLRGEAFTLSGEFLCRGDLDWTDMFLDPAKEAVLRRAVDGVNENGGDLESRGLMMMGPPGTGKTLAGRVMMRQADDATFIWISARDFYRSGAFGAFTYAFDLAAECADGPDAPATILFFEDVDNWLGADTIDLLKTEMDGLKRRKGILTVLTTNFPELLPEALIDRPGRFHDLLELALPTEDVRLRMLDAWLPAASEAVRAAAAKQTEGFSGAHLRELANYAGTIQRESGGTLDAALPQALAKLNEQRQLVASLHDGGDYRPRRHVRALVAASMAAVAKRGRVLSAANEGRIQTVRDGLEAHMGHLDAVLSQLNRQPPAEDLAEPADDGQRAVAVLLRDEPTDAVAVMLRDEDEATVDDAELREALQDAMRATLADLIREQTHVALARARGRVD